MRIEELLSKLTIDANIREIIDRRGIADTEENLFLIVETIIDEEMLKRSKEYDWQFCPACLYCEVEKVSEVLSCILCGRKMV